MSSKKVDKLVQDAQIQIILHMCRLIRAFVLQSYILWYLMILLADSAGPDQTAHLRSLIWAFAVCPCPEGMFSLSVAHHI